MTSPGNVLISTHAPRTGSDLLKFSRNLIGLYFNPRSPHGERRTTITLLAASTANFNPRSPHGERRRISLCQYLPHYFNPRSPHGERRLVLRTLFCNLDISTHAPRTGSDSTTVPIQMDCGLFQPTLPARGATPTASVIGCASRDFNPRSPHGERLHLRTFLRPMLDFNPRSPHGERRALHQHDSDEYVISTHAPRTGSDTTRMAFSSSIRHFNPRSPHGERPKRVLLF